MGKTFVGTVVPNVQWESENPSRDGKSLIPSAHGVGYQTKLGLQLSFERAAVTVDFLRRAKLEVL